MICSKLVERHFPGVYQFLNQKHIIYVWLDALTNYISALNFSETLRIQNLKFLA